MPAIEPSQDELQTLLAAVARGNRPAFRLLYERTAARLTGVARQIVRRPEVAEEILQECFVAIWERAGDYDSTQARPMTWLITIVRNRALDFARRPRVEAPIEDAAWFESVPDTTVNLDEEAVWRELYAPLAAELQRLAPLQRQAVTLAYYHGLTQTEIAAHLRCPLGTVKTLVRRALACLAPRLRQSDAGAEAAVSVARRFAA